jgi:hypothetical protein
MQCADKTARHREAMMAVGCRGSGLPPAHSFHLFRPHGELDQIAEWASAGVGYLELPAPCKKRRSSHHSSVNSKRIGNVQSGNWTTRYGTD